MFRMCRVLPRPTHARVLTSLSPWLEISVSAVVPFELAPTNALMSGGSGEGVITPPIADGEGVVDMLLCFELVISKIEGRNSLTTTENVSAQQVQESISSIPRVCIEQHCNAPPSAMQCWLPAACCFRRNGAPCDETLNHPRPMFASCIVPPLCPASRVVPPDHKAGVVDTAAVDGLHTRKHHAAHTGVGEAGP